MSPSQAAAPEIVFTPQTHEYRVDGVVWPGATSILKATGLSTDWDRMPPRVREAAERKRSLGTDVHEACRLLDRGELAWGSLDDALFPYVEAWEKYTRERGIHHWRAIEAVVYHSTYRYIGTLDRLAVIDGGGLVLQDIKLGDPDDAAGQYQTCAYLHAAAACGLLPDATSTAVQRECVQLLDTGSYRLSPYSSRDDWKVFQAALTVYHAQPKRTR